MGCYDYATSPTRGPSAGAMALYRVVLNSERYGPVTKGQGVYNVRPIRNGQTWSTHAEGRACDFGVEPGSVHGDSLYMALRDAAEPLGIQQILWNKLAWRCDSGERAASASVAKLHADHVHVELNRHAAATLTRSTVEKALNIVGAGATLVPDGAQILERGDQGNPVKDLQELLNATGLFDPQLRVDGDYGPATQTAVTRFQKQAPAVDGRAVTIDGIAGPQTITALNTHIAGKTVTPKPAPVSQPAERPPSLLNPTTPTITAKPATPTPTPTPTKPAEPDLARETVEAYIADLLEETATWIRTTHTK